MKKILIGGGTGFIGNALSTYLVQKGCVLHLLTRSDMPPEKNITYFQWDLEKKYIDPVAFDGVDTVINLTGTNIGEKRWTDQRKKAIINSRTQSAGLLYDYVSNNNIPIETYISASAVGYYGAFTSEKILDESSPNGDDFLATVCKKWEESAGQFKNAGSRVVILRQGAVMGKGEGMVKRLSTFAKLGINTATGDGKQYLPWIDLEDLVRMYYFILQNENIDGVYNAVASEHITMNEFSKSLLHAFGRKSILPNVPAFIIHLLYGELSVMLLRGTRVSNEKIKKAGFSFLFDRIGKALDKVHSKQDV